MKGLPGRNLIEMQLFRVLKEHFDGRPLVLSTGMLHLNVSMSERLHI